MKMKKIISVILFAFTGLSFVYANESVVSIIKESEVEDVRKVGYELCRFFTQKEKGYIHRIKDYLFGMEPEEELALKLKNLSLMNKDIDMIKTIFSGKASDNLMIRDLQKGCFDFLSEEVISLAHNLNATLTESNETLTATVTMTCIDSSNNQTMRGIAYSDDNINYEFNNSNLSSCSNNQLNLHNAFNTTYPSISYYNKLIELLGIEESEKDAFDEKLSAIFAEDYMEEEL